SYGALLHERRRAVHAATVEAVERLFPDPTADQVERLAHHAFAAEQWAKAAGYFHRAATQALGRSAYREAVALLARALATLGHLPETRETMTQAIDIRLDLRTALVGFEQFDRMLDELREAERLAEAIQDQHRLGRSLVYLTNHYY